MWGHWLYKEMDKVIVTSPVVSRILVSILECSRLETGFMVSSILSFQFLLKPNDSIYGWVGGAGSERWLEHECSMLAGSTTDMLATLVYWTGEQQKEK